MKENHTLIDKLFEKIEKSNDKELIEIGKACKMYRILNLMIEENLHVLDLSNKNIDDDDCFHIIEFLLKNPGKKFSEINLSNNKIGDASAFYFPCFLRFNKTVTTFNIAGNNISVNIINTIKSSLEHRPLKTNFISDHDSCGKEEQGNIFNV